MPLIRDTLGQVVPHGKVTRSKVADFLDGALPAWLTVGAGTETFVTPAAGVGHVQVATGAVLNDTAYLQSFEFVPSHFKAIWLTVEAFYLDSDTNITTFLTLGNALDATSGVKMYHTSSSSKAVLYGTGAGSTQGTLEYQIRASGEGVKRRNLTVLWLPADYEAFVLTGDQVVGRIAGSQLSPSATCRAFVGIQTKEAASHNFKVSQVKLDLVHN